MSFTQKCFFGGLATLGITAIVSLIAAGVELYKVDQTTFGIYVFVECAVVAMHLPRLLDSFATRRYEAPRPLPCPRPPQRMA